MSRIWSVIGLILRQARSLQHYLWTQSVRLWLHCENTIICRHFGRQYTHQHLSAIHWKSPSFLLFFFNKWHLHLAIEYWKGIIIIIPTCMNRRKIFIMGFTVFWYSLYIWLRQHPHGTWYFLVYIFIVMSHMHLYCTIIIVYCFINKKIINHENKKRKHSSNLHKIFYWLKHLRTLYNAVLQYKQ